MVYCCWMFLMQLLLCLCQIWTMLSIYVGIAAFSVVIVSFFVDNLPKHFVDTDTSITDSTKGEVRDNGQKSLLMSCACIIVHYSWCWTNEVVSIRIYIFEYRTQQPSKVLSSVCLNVMNYLNLMNLNYSCYCKSRMSLMKIIVGTGTLVTA